MNYFVLKRGEILGPFQRDELVAQLERNVFDETDLAQPEGSAHWTPLRLLLEGDSSNLSEPSAVAPDWQTLATWIWRRARHGIASDPLRTGFVFFGIGVAFLLLSFYPPALSLPWFAIAAYAGVLLFQRGAAGNGTLLLGCVLVAVAVALATMRKVPL